MTVPVLDRGCDTHVHIIGDPDRYPMVAGRRYTPGPALPNHLLAHLGRVGLTRAVLIQPSVYGTDNTCLLDALASLQETARAVVVVDQDVSASELIGLDKAGARGIRLNLESEGTREVDRLRKALTNWAPRLVDLGWHVQVYASQATVAACADLLQQLPVPCVLDHVAMWQDAACVSPEAAALLRAFETGNIYIKLSASYRVPLTESQLQGVVDRLVGIRPDRLLWASDWPHTSRLPGAPASVVSPYRDIAATALVAERSRWLPSVERMRQVCIDNAARLYRF
jgi:predicted TIM-barrel fold metal-dependent hydrolase